ncbi:MAG: bifunctional proline dehydrogenase/L-glutamate gamma-semialdehyde dehydrogenase PutA [Methylohalobius sp. ZOD2]
MNPITRDTPEDGAEHPDSLSPRRKAIAAAYLADEAQTLESLLPEVSLSDGARQRVHERARRLVQSVRQHPLPLDAFLSEFELSSEEGVLLMCLAEALLRIPDDQTAERLIRDKLSRGKWDRHLGHNASFLVNASTFGLLLTGRLMRLEIEDSDTLFQKLLQRGEAAVHVLVVRAMKILGGQFILATTIEKALARRSPDFRYSFDMLGEEAFTAEDVEAYFRSYRHAIAVLARHRGDESDVLAVPGISVKLSALHPRYTFTQGERVRRELIPRLLTLAKEARAARIGLTLDAEEAERLDLMLDIFEAVFCHPDLSGWEGFGLAVQAYQKRAGPLIEYLRHLADARGKRIPLRLVKGAYWDTEIKRAQQQGWSDYPVFTRKMNTDVSYLALARRLLAFPQAFFPQFATHNAHTVAWILEVAEGRPLEFQRLQGMGEPLYRALRQTEGDIPCRVYAPVGGFRELLPYLMRRLLENGANTSFVHRLSDARLPIEEVIADPVGKVRTLETIPHPQIPQPADLYQPQRPNSPGPNLSDPLTYRRLNELLSSFRQNTWEAQPWVSGKGGEGKERMVYSPVDRGQVVGTVVEAGEESIAKALACAEAAAPEWDRVPAEDRAACLERAAELYQSHRDELLALCIREGGRCLSDAVDEVREAIDFLYYYAAEARRLFANPLSLPGPVGESNRLYLHGRGPFVCISPWNFPLAIFTGQAAAALAAGNPVLAKPAEQTPLIAALAVRLLQQAGIPNEVLHFLPGGGEVGAALVGDPRIRGVAFTGSTDTAWEIQRNLAGRRAPIAAFVAETGGVNAMIVDSSALPQQVVADVLASTFNSAGQRCSALRILFLQAEVADPVLDMLCGALAELKIGDPWDLSTDLGPLIDEDAVARLESHRAYLETNAQPLARLDPPPLPGCYFGPAIFEITALEPVNREVFGPILHVMRYSAGHLDELLERIHGLGYGLTLGVHSRIDGIWERIAEHARVGNIYVNRNMIGAVVGTHPFGGEGLSGTGPKAGGPNYLARFAYEKSLSVNTAAVGGDPDLLSLREV